MTLRVPSSDLAPGNSFDAGLPAYNRPECTTDVADPLAAEWRWAASGPIKTGSDDHKELFCCMLLETHDRYKPAVIPWPKLNGPALVRLTGLPFWDIAVETEVRAAANIQQLADREPDPLIAQALNLMAFEENRHREVLAAMIDHYGIPHHDPPDYRPTPRAEWEFLRTGYGECLDSFFAFGLFQLARRSGFFPEALVEVFEPVIQEEARHIVFFVNWAAYTQARRPFPTRPVFMLKRLAALAVNAKARATLARGGDNSNFAVEGRDSLDVNVTIGELAALCLTENERRLGLLDPRLLRPGLMPRFIKLVRPILSRL